MKKQPETYASEEEAAELIRGSLIPNPLRLAAMLEETMQWPLHGKAADCLREMHELIERYKQDDVKEKQAQPLTDEQIRKVNQEVWGYVSKDHTKMWEYARAIEAAHNIGEKA